MNEMMTRRETGNARQHGAYNHLLLRQSQGREGGRRGGRYSYIKGWAGLDRA